MASIARTIEDLTNRFNIQVELLKLACSNYDGGIEIAGFNIATSIRVFVHDTHLSTSALTHINNKAIQYLDTCNINPNPAITFTGLIYKSFNGVHDGQGGTALFRPLFTNSFHSKINNWINFNTWWNAVIFQNADGAILTRKTLVLTAANQEGGAHIDDEIDELYDKFRHSYSSRTVLKGTITGAIRGFDNVPVLPAIRQIGYELIKSFENAGLITI